MAAQAAASSGPAARWMAPQTPPPGARCSFAALTMASTGRVVMSARRARSGMGSVALRAAILARVAAADQESALAIDQDRLPAAMRLLDQRALVAEPVQPVHHAAGDAALHLDHTPGRRWEEA